VGLEYLKMSTPREQTLTKKQKKSLAFRQRNKSKSEAGDVPIADLQEIAQRNDDDVEKEAVIKVGVSKEVEAAGEIYSKGLEVKEVVQRGNEEAGKGSRKGKGKLAAVDMKVSKKRKRKDGEEEEVQRSEDDKEMPSMKKKKGDGGELNTKQRFILFVGVSFLTLTLK
jgi:hypothetical protein